jgi:hypothetical protein
MLTRRVLGGGSIAGHREQVRRALEQMLLEIQDEHLRVELLATHVRRTARGAPPALRAVVEIEEVLPRHLRHRADSEGLRVLEVHGPGSTLGRERREEHVERCEEDVEVLRIREPDQEAQQEHRVHPPRGVEDHLDAEGRKGGERMRDGHSRELPPVGRLRSQQDPSGVGDQVGHHEAEDQGQDHQPFR